MARASTIVVIAGPSTSVASSPRASTTKAPKKGWCLYKLGCKGPTTYNACATVKWNNGTSFPIEAGHGCIGCAEPDFWDKGGFYDALSVTDWGSPDRHRDRCGRGRGARRRRRCAGAQRTERREGGAGEEAVKTTMLLDLVRGPLFFWALMIMIAGILWRLSGLIFFRIQSRAAEAQGRQSDRGRPAHRGAAFGAAARAGKEHHVSALHRLRLAHRLVRDVPASRRASAAVQVHPGFRLAGAAERRRAGAGRDDRSEYCSRCGFAAGSTPCCGSSPISTIT